MKFRTHTLAGIISAVAVCAAHAEIYKWVDKNGETVYSNTPPPGKQVDLVKPKFSKYISVPAAAKASPPAPATPPAPLTPEKQKELRTACAKTRALLAQIESTHRMRYVNDKKEDTYATPEEREARIKDANKKIKDYCK